MKKLLHLILLFSFSYSYSQNIDRIEASSGKVIGMTSSGGSHGNGVIYQYDPLNHHVTVPVSFLGGGVTIGQPIGSLMQASNGRLYGMTYAGGANNQGTIFSYNINTGFDSILVSFNGLNGSLPKGNHFIQASDGLLYGMTYSGGTQNDGVLFSFNPVTNKDSVLVNFSVTNGGFPQGSLVQATNGLLYGITTAGGTGGNGTLFSYDIVTHAFAVLVNFGTDVGQGTPIQAANGLLYFMSCKGGTFSKGCIESYNINTSARTILFSFNGTDGSNSGTIPSNEQFVQDTNGLLYGMTMYGGTNNGGVIFSFDTATNAEQVLYNMNTQHGLNAVEGFIIGKDGLLYSVTGTGGSLNDGVVFSYNIATGKDSVLHVLTGIDGTYDAGTVIQASDSNLYAVTYNGGSHNNGVLFRLNPITNKDTVLINFGAGTNNNGNFMKANNGLIYGLTENGGTYNNGTLIMYNPFTGKDTILLNFNDTNGANPQGNLLQAYDGSLYGMARNGGKHGFGVVFRYDITNGKDTVLFSFNDTNGRWPYFSLMQSSDSLLYGMAWMGGKYDKGVLFSYNPKMYKDSVRFSLNDTNGVFGFGNLVQYSDGMIYGTANQGGLYGEGVLFRYNPANGQDTILINFNSGPKGYYPAGDLIVDTAAKKIYGTTEYGGTLNSGVLYSYNFKTLKDSVMLTFDGADGANPLYGILVRDSATGMLYGTTYSGGSHQYGVLYKFDPYGGQDTVLVNFNDTNGANPMGVVLIKNGLNSINNLYNTRNTIVVYPNPFKDLAIIVFNEEGKHFVEIDDMNGKKLKYMECNNKQQEISRDNIAIGMYVVKVYDNKKQFISSTKIIAQ